jgi:uncharacterized RDD family membrane protein YckC
MSEFQAQNPFQPPRAAVHDHEPPAAEMALADPGKRLAAVLIDGVPGMLISVIGVAVLLPLILPSFRLADVDASMARLFEDPHFVTRFIVVCAVGGAAGIAWMVYNIVLIYQHGQTFGKKVMGIRMVRTDGSRLSFKRYLFLRNIAYSVLCAIPFIGWPVRIVDKLLIFRDSRQCLHDMIADTTVATAASSLRATLAGSRVELPTIRS